ncbi:MAG: DUF1192 domain-containing protein [Alphaproteobacteria bacterium]|nr:DUF1192 domain-containing protein [Alphaproteobacteria bacterium]
MFGEDLSKKPKTQDFPRDIVSMSVSDLEIYIGELEAEIIRVRGDIQKKKASIEAASSIFKS